MTPAEYKEFCETTYAAPEGTDREEYLRLLLIEELGEVASLFAKAMRDGVRRTCTACGGHGFINTYTLDSGEVLSTRPDQESYKFDRVRCTHDGCNRGGVTTYGPDAVDRNQLLKELGDVMWCDAMLGGFHWDVMPNDWPYDISEQRWRADGGYSEDPLDYIASIGSPNWYSYDVSDLCFLLGFTPEEVALANVAKLRRRVADGTIHGAGSER